MLRRANIRFGTMQGVAARLHVVEIDDTALAVDKRNRQRQGRIVHPETMRRRLFKHEQHAAVGGELFALHQAASTLARGGCDFNLEQLLADAQLESCGAIRYAGGTPQSRQK